MVTLDTRYGRITVRSVDLLPRVLGYVRDAAGLRAWCPGASPPDNSCPPHNKGGSGGGGGGGGGKSGGGKAGGKSKAGTGKKGDKPDAAKGTKSKKDGSDSAKADKAAYDKFKKKEDVLSKKIMDAVIAGDTQAALKLKEQKDKLYADSRPVLDRVEADRQRQTTQSVRDKFGESVQVSNDSSPAVQTHIADLDRVPPDVARAAAAAGVTVQVADGPVPTFAGMEHHAGRRPRGWPPGTTWDEVGGAYDPSRRVVIAGAGQHNSTSLVLHEYGHAIGFASGAHDTEEWSGIHRDTFPRLDPYSQQGGPGSAVGRQELWAEAYAVHTRHGPAETERRYGPRVRSYVEREVSNFGKRGSKPPKQSKPRKPRTPRPKAESKPKPKAPAKTKPKSKPKAAPKPRKSRPPKGKSK